MTGSIALPRPFALVAVLTAWLTCACVLVVLASPSATAREPHDGASLISLIGFDTALEQVGQSLKSEPPGEGPEADDPAFAAAWAAAVAESYDPTKLKADLAARLEKGLSAAEREEIAAFYATDFARKVVDLEREAARRDNAEELMGQIEDLTAEIEGQPVRKRLYGEIADGLGLADLTLNSAINMILATQIGLEVASRKAGSTAPEKSLADITAEVEAVREPLAGMMQQLLPLVMIDTYRSLSEDELQRLRDFLLSPLGRKLYAVLGPAFDATLSAASLAFGKRLGEGLGTDPI